MTSLRPVAPKTLSDVAREWDVLSPIRARQLASGLDLSYDTVLVPTVKRLLGPLSGSTRLLDVGCGTGTLTAMLAVEAGQTVAVDPSPDSVAVARQLLQVNGVGDKVDLITTSVEAYADSATRRFDCIVANMTLMDAPDLRATMRAIAKLADVGARFVWTVTHPWFWPRYCGYDREPWFNYAREQFVEGEFKISNGRTGLISTHVHRPLHLYTGEITGAGFQIQAIEEPLPDSATMAKYPEPWQFPRFLASLTMRSGC